MQSSFGTPLRLAHLPILMDVLRRSKVLEVIDAAIADDRRCKVSTSECVAVMLCAVFSGGHDLWRVREKLERFDMKTVMQDHGFDIQEFPEERLAKALDDLWTADTNRITTAIALQMVEAWEVKTDFLHFDTTSLSFYGAYEKEDFTSFTEAMPPAPRVVHGYSKNRRGDLKQILYGTLMTADGGIPLAGRGMDGNRSDNESCAEFFAELRKLVKDPHEVCGVADSKGWCGRVLGVVKDQGMRLLSRLPRTTTLHADLMQASWQPTGRIERPAAKKGEEPDHIEFQGFDRVDAFTRALDPATPGGKPTSETFTLPVRAVKIRSSALLRTKVATAIREKAREELKAKRLVAQQQAVPYACRPDAEAAAARLREQHGFIAVDLVITTARHEGPFQRGRGRPRKHLPATVNGDHHFRLTIDIVAVTEDLLRQRLTDAATFILIRTAQPNWTLPDADMIAIYKGQYHNEHGFAWLKSGMSLNPVFLKTPHRIGSLCFIYWIGLMAYNLIQRTVRATLTANKTGLPYHRRKPSDRITTRFFLDLFAQVQIIPVTTPDGQDTKHLAGFSEWVDKACRALGTDTARFHPVGK
jgi:transposase